MRENVEKLKQLLGIGMGQRISERLKTDERSSRCPVFEIQTDRMPQLTEIRGVGHGGRNVPPCPRYRRSLNPRSIGGRITDRPEVCGRLLDSIVPRLTNPIVIGLVRNDQHVPLRKRLDGIKQLSNAIERLWLSIQYERAVRCSERMSCYFHVMIAQIILCI